PVRLPDQREYCAACCASMATDSFEMETGEPFVQWIAKHPKLVLRYQPMEMSVRRLGFVFPLCATIGGVAAAFYGAVQYHQAGFPPLFLAAYFWALAALGVAVFLVMKNENRAGAKALKMAASFLAFLLPVAGIAGVWKFGRPCRSE